MTFKRGKVYYIDKSWRDVGRIYVSTGMRVKAPAEQMEHMLKRLRDRGQRDLLRRVANGTLKIVDLYEAYERGELDKLVTNVALPPLRELLERWKEHLATGLARRTRRPYAPKTQRRYSTSWDMILESLPANAQLSDLTDGFFLDYRSARKRYAGRKQTTLSVSSEAINQDMIAAGAFFTWLEGQGYKFNRPKLPKERRPGGRERYLEAAEIEAFQEECPDVWWPFFAVLLYTGMRWREAAGLRGADVLMGERRIVLREGARRLKTGASQRILPIGSDLQHALAEHFVRQAVGPTDLVFPALEGGSKSAEDKCRNVWKATCRAAGIEGAVMHDLRHTFGVHAAKSGVPLARLQKLLGHSSPLMTMRYMAHSPEAFMDQDATAIEGSMKRAEARETAARKGVRPA